MRGRCAIHRALGIGDPPAVGRHKWRPYECVLYGRRAPLLVAVLEAKLRDRLAGTLNGWCLRVRACDLGPNAPPVHSLVRRRETRGAAVLCVGRADVRDRRADVRIVLAGHEKAADNERATRSAGKRRGSCHAESIALRRNRAIYTCSALGKGRAVVNGLPWIRRRAVGLEQIRVAEAADLQPAILAVWAIGA